MDWKQLTNTFFYHIDLFWFRLILISLKNVRNVEVYQNILFDLNKPSSFLVKII